MSDKNEQNPGTVFQVEVPTKSESNSMTALVVSNWSPLDKTGLPSCSSMTYTVGASSEPADHYVAAETPEAFGAGAVRTLKSRLRSRVSASSNDHDASGDF